jgi:hypothetical protein
METVCFSETLASTDESTRRHNPEEHHPHRRENLKSHIEGGGPSFELEITTDETMLSYAVGGYALQQ